MKILPSFGAIHKARQKSEQEAEFTRKFLESTKLELEMRVADKSDHLWEKRILNEWPIVRVKRIMKRPTIFGSPRMVSANAVYLMAYATRVFLRLITARAAQIMIAEKRTTLLVRDIIAAVKDSSIATSCSTSSTNGSGHTCPCRLLPSGDERLMRLGPLFPTRDLSPLLPRRDLSPLLPPYCRSRRQDREWRTRNAMPTVPCPRSR